MSPNPSLFDSPAFRLATVSHQIKCALNKAVFESKLSREEILIRVNNLASEAGVSLTKGNGALSLDTFSKWLNPNASDYKPSTEALMAIYYALDKNIAIVEPLSKAFGIEIVGPKDIYYRDLGKIQCEMKELRKKQRAIEASK
ncbi:MAG: hypothetical protein LBT47_01220 [Deltaproteobacteria bacterium]|nr:hypothetical protein [Deltaproteobacteria bacterium]